MANVVDIDVVPKVSKQAVDEVQRQMRPEVGASAAPSDGRPQSQGRSSHGTDTKFDVMKFEVAKAASVIAGLGAAIKTGDLSHLMTGAKVAEGVGQAEDLSEAEGSWDKVTTTMKVAAGIALSIWAPELAMTLKLSTLLFKGLRLGVEQIEKAVVATKEVFMATFNEIKEYGDSVAGYVSEYNPGAVERFTIAVRDLNAVIGYILEPAMDATTKLVRNLADGLMIVAPILRAFVNVFATWPINTTTWLIAKLAGLAAKLSGNEGASVGMATNQSSTGSAASLSETALRSAFSLGGGGPFERTANATEGIFNLVEEISRVIFTQMTKVPIPRMPGAS